MVERKSSPVRRKLYSNAGESIGETLIALLISALALVMLAGAISTTANVIKKCDDVMASYYEGDAALVEHSGTNTMTVGISAESSETTVETRTVNYTENAAFASKPVVAYKISTTP